MSKKNDIVRINGPTNVVRMEGFFSGIKKIIYLFMDFHVSLTVETKCQTYPNLDFHQYFSLNTENITRVIDLMFEGHLSDTKKPNNMYRKKYIEEASDYFNYKFNESMTKKRKGEKVDVRFHYIDVRDSIDGDINDYIYMLQDSIKTLRHDSTTMTYKTVENIRKIVTYIKDKMKILQKLLSDDSIAQEEDIPEIIKKIKHIYKHRIVFENMRELFNHIDDLFFAVIYKLDALIKTIDRHMYMIDVIQNYKLHYSKVNNGYFYGIPNEEYIDFVDDIVKKVIYIGDVSTILFADIMDVYFLRRFMDKDYITHAVVYTGAAHSINYIQHLLTKYNFKITHASYSFENDMEKLNLHLKQYSDTTDRTEYEKCFYSPILKQCSDVSHFPKNFG